MQYHCPHRYLLNTPRKPTFCAAKLKECILWPSCYTKLKRWLSTAENPPHRALIINMLISMSQLLKMILGTTYWIFNLQIIYQIGCNGSEQWGPHVSWAGKADGCRQQRLKFWRVCLPRTWAPYWLLRASCSREIIMYFPYVCIRRGRDIRILP